MLAELRKKAGVVDDPPADPPKPKDERTPPVDPIKQTEGEAPPADPKPVEPPAADPKGKTKVSPWKLVDEHKAARLKAETELAELRKTIPDPSKLQQETERMAAVEARNKQLEDHIRYVDYSLSQEFADKYQKPYTDAWNRWMTDLGELTIRDAATGSDRPIAPADILDLVNMPLQKAREQAEQTFGAFADDVMSARKEIRSLFDAQRRALDEAKKNGKEWQEKRSKAETEAREALTKEVTQAWDEANKSFQSDERFSKWFTPREGDEEGNTRLAKGYELADRAFSVSPLDPSLTKEQRSKVASLHAAIRHRAAAFGRLTYENDQLKAKIDELSKEIDSYKAATPGVSGSRGTEQKPPGQGTARDQVFGALRNLAK